MPLKEFLPEIVPHKQNKSTFIRANAGPRITATCPRTGVHNEIRLFLVTRAAWVSSEISIKCVGALRSFPPPLPFFHYVLLPRMMAHTPLRQ